MSKKQEKNMEPQYYMSATNIQTLNYKVHYMKPLEKFKYILIAFVVGAAVGYIFYGGIGKDEFGQATNVTWFLNIAITTIIGLIAVKLFLPVKTKSIIDKRRSELGKQFRDMLDGLTTSLGTGKNVNNSFVSIYEDLKVQYNEEAYIVKELEVIISGINNNIPIEDILQDFGERSDNDDIKGFANVFKISYRKGGNLKDIIRNTHSTITDKMEITEDIETILTSNKMELNIMIVMPIMIIGLMKLMSPELASNFVSPSGIISTTLSLFMFVASYLLGKKIIDIKV